MPQNSTSDPVNRPGNLNTFLSLCVHPWELVTFFGAVASAATAFGFLGRFWWFLDLFSHFRVQYFFVLSMLALALFLGRRRKAAVIFGIIAVVNLCTIVPLYFGKEAAPTVRSRSYRSLLMNVNTGSGVPEKASQAIRDLHPDVLALEEVDDHWLSAFSITLRAYPYSRTSPRDDNFGIALFSKYPLVRSAIRQIGEAEVPSIIAELDVPDGRITVIATHPLPPAGRENSRLRNEQFTRLAEIVKQANSPVLLLGDLNATPWCSHFQRLLRQAGLRDSSQGRGVQPTWPTFLPILLIPIDHCLHSSGIHVTRRTTGPRIGSDHYLLVVDFLLTKAEAQKTPVEVSE